MAKLRKLMLNCWVLSEILSPQVKTPQHLSQPWQPETTSSEATSNRMPINFWCVCWISWVRTWNSTIKHPQFAPVPNRSFNEYNSLYSEPSHLVVTPVPWALAHQLVLRRTIRLINTLRVLRKVCGQLWSVLGCAAGIQQGPNHGWLDYDDEPVHHEGGSRWLLLLKLQK